MNRPVFLSLVGILIVARSPVALCADDSKPEAGYISLFNNKDLTGWGYKTNNFNGKTESSDGRYTAKDGVLVVNPRDPRLMQVLWTTREFPRDFILKLEFRAAVNADSAFLFANLSFNAAITSSPVLTRNSRNTSRRIGMKSRLR